MPNDTPAPGPQLRLWISALSHVVSRLERTHSALPHAIITMPWTTMDSQFVKSYTSFIGMLVSARPEYLSSVLEKIAQGFTYSAYYYWRIDQGFLSDLLKILERPPSALLCRNLHLPPSQDALSTIGYTICCGIYLPSYPPYRLHFKTILFATSLINDCHSLHKSLTFVTSYT